MVLQLLEEPFPIHNIVLQHQKRTPAADDLRQARTRKNIRSRYRLGYINRRNTSDITDLSQNHNLKIQDQTNKIWLGWLLLFPTAEAAVDSLQIVGRR